MPAKKFQIWKSFEDDFLLDENHDITHFVDVSLLSGYFMVYEFEAINYIDCLQKRNDYFGYGKYKPMIDPSTNEPYPEDLEEFE